MALWVFVYLGTTPIGQHLDRVDHLGRWPADRAPRGFGGVSGRGVLAAFVQTPHNPDEALTDLGQ